MQNLFAGANGLGTLTNLEKRTISIPVHEPSNGLVKPPQRTLACFSSSCWLNNQQAYSLGFACAPKNTRMDVNKIQNPTYKDVISQVLDKFIVFTCCFHQFYKTVCADQWSRKLV